MELGSIKMNSVRNRISDTVHRHTQDVVRSRVTQAGVFRPVYEVLFENATLRTINHQFGLNRDAREETDEIGH